MKIIISSLVLLFCSSLFGQSDEIKTIDSIINSKIGEKDPGLMVGIVKDGTIIYEKYRGLANLQHQVEMSQNTRSNIASTAKQFTALMILDLSLKHKLSLEDDIRTYLPNLYPKVKESIKVRHLINHTSGIRDYVTLFDLKNKAWWREVGLDNDDVIELLEKQEDLAFNPGTIYSYSNSGYIVLAKIIEKVTGEKFTNYSKQFFNELGMNNTAYVEKYMGVIPNRAEPYADWGDGQWLQSPTVTKVAGDGFLYTTLKDQLTYEQAIQNALKNNNTLLLQSQQAIPNSEITTYGFGLNLFNWFRGERSAVHHDGGTNGYNSQTVRFTDNNLTVFVMSNNANIGSDIIADEIANVLLPKLDKTKKANYNSDFTSRLTSTKTSYTLGQYNSPNGDLIRIEEENGKIFYKRGGDVKIELIKESVNKFYPSYNSKDKIVFYENDMVLYYPSGDKRIFTRGTEVPASINDISSVTGIYYSTELDMSFELLLTDRNELKIKFSNRDQERNVEVLNKNQFISRNFIFKVQRDIFDRPIAMLVTLGRALNNRFIKKTNLKFQPKIETENGSIQVTTIGSKNGDASDILLTKNYPNGNEIWFKQFGGNSYDKASSILDTEDGYLIIGSTSSYGNGNYDMLVIKTDKKGHKLWQNTYGDFFNEYGYSAEKTATGFVIKGTIQNCDSNDFLTAKCTTNVWFVNIDQNGKELSRTILEELH